MQHVNESDRMTFESTTGGDDTVESNRERDSAPVDGGTDRFGAIHLHPVPSYREIAFPTRQINSDSYQAA